MGRMMAWAAMLAKVEIAARLKLSISPRKPLPVPSKARAKASPKKDVIRSVVRVFSCSMRREASWAAFTAGSAAARARL